MFSIKNIFSFFIFCLIFCAAVTVIGAGVYADLHGYSPLLVPGLLSALSSVVGLVLPVMVTMLLKDPSCSWKVFGPDGALLASGSGLLFGGDTPRAYSKAMATNGLNSKGYADQNGSPFRFLQLAADGEQVSGGVSILNMRKEYSVILRLTKNPLTADEAVVKKAENREKAAEKEKKEKEEMKKLIQEAVQELLG